MIVAGWADGYRNNTFRTVARLAAAGTPHRLLAGPWAHADPTTAMPGPRIDFDTELAGWFDQWLRGDGPHEDGCDVFVRSSTRPEPDLDLHEGHWLRLPSVPPTSAVARARPGAPRRASTSCPSSPTSAPPPGSTAPATCPGGCPATSASTTRGR